MTASTLLTLRDSVLDLAKLAAHLPSNVSFEMQPDDDHSLHLSVAVLAEGSEAYTDHIAIVGHLRDEICIGIGCTFVEHDDRGFRIRKLADYGHLSSSQALLTPSKEKVETAS